MEATHVRQPVIAQVQPAVGDQQRPGRRRREAEYRRRAFDRPRAAGRQHQVAQDAQEDPGTEGMAGGKGQGVVRAQQEIAGGGPAAADLVLDQRGHRESRRHGTDQQRGTPDFPLPHRPGQGERTADHGHRHRRSHRGHSRKEGRGQRVPRRHEAVMHRPVQGGRTAVGLHCGEHGPEDRLARDQQADCREEEPPLGRPRRAGGGSLGALGKEHRSILPAATPCRPDGGWQFSGSSAPRGRRRGAMPPEAAWPAGTAFRTGSASPRTLRSSFPACRPA